MNSNLVFQMLLFYHSYFDVLYAFMLIPSGIVKIAIGNNAETPMPIVSLVLTFFFCVTEIYRINFGYSGNINESFPELIAFIIQTFLFSLTFTVMPMTAPFQFPHEISLYVINLVFLILEILVGSFTMARFSNTQSAAFYRRTAPLIDKKFKKKYQGHEEVGSNREIQLGLQ